MDEAEEKEAKQGSGGKGQKIIRARRRRGKSAELRLEKDEEKNSIEQSESGMSNEPVTLRLRFSDGFLRGEIGDYRVQLIEENLDEERQISAIQKVFAKLFKRSEEIRRCGTQDFDDLAFDYIGRACINELVVGPFEPMEFHAVEDICRKHRKNSSELD